MKKKQHYPFVYLVLFYAGGILLARLISMPLWGLVSGSVLVSVLISFWWNRRLSNVLLMILFLILGGFSYQGRARNAQTPLDKIARYNYGKPVKVAGRVVTDVRTKYINHAIKKDFHLQLGETKDSYGFKAMDDKILVQIFRDQDIRYGDKLILEGRLHRPFEFDQESNTSYRQYLYQRGIKWILSVKKVGVCKVVERDGGSFLKSQALFFRKRAENILHQYLSDKEAGIMQAILLGNRAGLSKHIRGLFVQTGTAHILAISGLHVGVIAGILLIFIKIFPIPRKAQYVATILILIGYVFMTGARPSILRATIMTVIFLGTFLFEKNQSAFNTLGFAAFLLLAFNPFYLFDVGFQLSFSCVISIIFVSRYMSFKPKNRYIKRVFESFFISLGIWVGVAGLVAYYFMIITPITIIANVFIVPMLGLIVSLGFGLILTGSIWPLAGACFGICTKIALNAMVALISFFNEWPAAFYYLKGVKLWHVVVYYSILAFIIILFLTFTRFKSVKNVLSNELIKR